MNTSLIHQNAKKLGITSTKSIGKAEEFLRLVDVRGYGRTLSSYAKVLICLDLASRLAGSTISKPDVIRLSGLTKTQYITSHQTLEKLLGLSSNVSINDLCLSHSVTECKDLAIKILNTYESDINDKGLHDLQSPVYQVTAVVAACSVMKMKVDKRKMYETSACKRAIYDKVMKSMLEIANSVHDKKTTNFNKGKKKTLAEIVESNVKQLEEKENSPKKKLKSTDTTEEEVDDFEEWKRKILAEANAEK